MRPLPCDAAAAEDFDFDLFFAIVLTDQVEQVERNKSSQISRVKKGAISSQFLLSPGN